MRIYLAGTAKSVGNRRYLEGIASRLEEDTHDVFLPHRDGKLPGRQGEEKGLLTSMNRASMGRMVFEGCLDLILHSDAVVAVLDGICWGTTLELGYAYAHKTHHYANLIIVGIYTDPIDPLDIMRLHACDTILRSEEELPGTLKQLEKQSQRSAPTLH